MVRYTHWIFATFFVISIVSLFGIKLEAAQVELKIHHQVLESRNLKTFFGVYDKNGLLVDDITPDDIYVQYDSHNGRVESLNKFSSERFGTAYLFMIDISKSMSNFNFNQIKQSIYDWTVNLNIGDSVAIMTFGETVNLVQDFTFDKTAVQESLELVKRTDMLTKYYDALRLSSEIISRNDTRLPFRRVVITLTDGLNDLEEGAVQENPDQLYEQIESLQVPYYTIGFAERMTSKKRDAIDQMRALSNTTGGIFFNANKIGIQDAFLKSQESIDNVFLLSTSCSRCLYNKPEIVFNLEVRNDGNLYQASRSIYLDLPAPQTLPPLIDKNSISIVDRMLDYWYLLLSILLAIFLLLIFLYKRKQNNMSINLSENSLAYEAFHENDSDRYIEPIDLKDFTLELKVVGDFNQVYSCKFNLNCIIGRSSKSNLCLKVFSDISSSHCKVYLANNQFLIDDLDSTNGTFLNGAKVVQKCPISSGDELTLGANKFKIFIREN